MNCQLTTINLQSDFYQEFISFPLSLSLHKTVNISIAAVTGHYQLHRPLYYGKLKPDREKAGAAIRSLSGESMQAVV